VNGEGVHDLPVHVEAANLKGSGESELLVRERAGQLSFFPEAVRPSKRGSR